MNIYAVPTEVIPIYNRALELSNRGDLSSALNEYKSAIKVYPNFIEAFNNIGEIYSALGERDMAISTFQRALDIDRNYKVLLNLGVEYYNVSDLRIALEYFTESLSKKPNFLEGNFYSGLVYFNLKEINMAERYFYKVVEIDKRHLKSNYLLSYIYYDWKEYIKTLACLDNIREITDNKVFLNKYYGFCFYHLGKFDKAVDHLTTAVESSPTYNKFKDYISNLTYENKMKEIGNIDEKIKEMEDKMVKIKPSLREYTRLSLLYTYKGEYKKAEDILSPFMKNNDIPSSVKSKVIITDF